MCWGLTPKGCALLEVRWGDLSASPQQVPANHHPGAEVVAPVVHPRAVLHVILSLRGVLTGFLRAAEHALKAWSAAFPHERGASFVKRPNISCCIKRKRM